MHLTTAIQFTEVSGVWESFCMFSDGLHCTKNKKTYNYNKAMNIETIYKRACNTGTY